MDIVEKLREHGHDPLGANWLLDAADEIEQLRFSWAACAQQLRDACTDLEDVEQERDMLRAVAEAAASIDEVCADVGCRAVGLDAAGGQSHTSDGLEG